MLKTLISIGKGTNYDSVPLHPELTDSEIIAIRQFLRTTHAWDVFRDNLRMERFVGTMVITFQLFVILYEKKNEAKKRQYLSL